MLEKFRSSPEEENNHDISLKERENLNIAVEGYLAQQIEPLTEVVDGNVDDVLARYIEKGPELSSDVKASLRKAIRSMLAQRISDVNQSVNGPR